MPHGELLTKRLALQAFSIDLIDAFLSGDKAAAELAAEARFDDPFLPPPETGDVLDYFRAMITNDTSGGLFVPRLVIRRSDRTCVGSIGVNPPDESGTAMTGYSVYSAHEGNGYASEACQYLTDYTLATGLVSRVIATIPVGHIASECVAGRAGLSVSGEPITQDGMVLRIWEQAAN